MKIYFDGCAKTYGAAVQHNIKQRYSTLLCDKLGAEEYNIAIAGSSNRRIVRNLIENDLSKYDLFVIQMTKRDRLEWFCKKKNEWRKVNGAVLDAKSSKHIEEKQHWENYYDKIYTDEMGVIDEKICFYAIKSLLQNKKHIIMSIDEKSNHDYDLPLDFVYRRGVDYKKGEFGIDDHKEIENLVISLSLIHI